MFKKTYLTGYMADQYQALGFGTRFTLDLRNVWFWGLFETNSEGSIFVDEWQKLNETTDKWDRIIRDKEALK